VRTGPYSPRVSSIADTRWNGRQYRRQQISPEGQELQRHPYLLPPVDQIGHGERRFLCMELFGRKPDCIGMEADQSSIREVGVRRFTRGASTSQKDLKLGAADSHPAGALSSSRS